MSTSTAVQHQPWCRDHYTEDDFTEQPGWCHHTVLEVGEPGHQRMGVSIQARLHDNADPGIDCYVDDDKLSPDEARQMAAALMRAADVLEEAQGR